MIYKLFILLFFSFSIYAEPYIVTEIDEDVKILTSPKGDIKIQIDISEDLTIITDSKPIQMEDKNAD